MTTKREGQYSGRHISDPIRRAFRCEKCKAESVPTQMVVDDSGKRRRWCYTCIEERRLERGEE